MLANYNYFRDYDPAKGGYAESDPIGLRGGLNTYAYVGANPVMSIDPRGLALLLCNRKAQGLFALVSANHGYLWDTRNDQACGAHGNKGRGMTEGPEAGPGVDECVEIFDSDGKEDEVMSCCRRQGLDTYRPFTNDCHAREKRCVDRAPRRPPKLPHLWPPENPPAVS